MNEYITVDLGLLNHPKYPWLETLIGQDPLGYLVHLWMALGFHYRDGKIRPQLVEHACRWKGEPGRLLSALRECEMYDINGDQEVHGWKDRSGRALLAIEKKRSEKLERDRVRQRDLAGSRPSSPDIAEPRPDSPDLAETRDTETETETKTEKGGEQARPPSASRDGAGAAAPSGRPAGPVVSGRSPFTPAEAADIVAAHELVHRVLRVAGVTPPAMPSPRQTKGALTLLKTHQADEIERVSRAALQARPAIRAKVVSMFEFPEDFARVQGAAPERSKALREETDQKAERDKVDANELQAAAQARALAANAQNLKAVNRWRRKRGLPPIEEPPPGPAPPGPAAGSTDISTVSTSSTEGS